MYVGMYKNRLYENKFLEEYGYLFETNKIMPYIEVIQLKIRLTTSTEEEIIAHYDQCFQSSYFIDFYTFADSEYKQFDIEKVDYSISLRTDSAKRYFDRLEKTKISQKVIPVISIKEVRDNLLDTESILNVIKSLQEIKKQIAVRIEADLFNDYFDAIKNVLRESDYLFFDVKEENVDPYILDIMEFDDNDKFIKILTNSPRKEDIYNSKYLESGYAELINNFARKEYKEHGFDGYADYSGLKDEFPRAGGGPGGAALAVFYDHIENQYYTIKNKNTQLGVNGYPYVIEELMRDEIQAKLRSKDCLAYKYVEDMINRGKPGNFATWNFITILRTLSEMKKVYK